MQIKIVIFAVLAFVLSGCGGKEEAKVSTDTTAEQVTTEVETIPSKAVVKEEVPAATKAAANMSDEGELLGDADTGNFLDELEKADGKDLTLDESMLNGEQQAREAAAAAAEAAGEAATQTTHATKEAAKTGSDVVESATTEIGEAATSLQEGVEALQDMGVDDMLQETRPAISSE